MASDKILPRVRLFQKMAHLSRVGARGTVGSIKYQLISHGERKEEERRKILRTGKSARTPTAQSQVTQPLNACHRGRPMTPTDGLLYYPNYIKGKITHNNILLTLT